MRIGSLSGVLVTLIALGIIFIGVREVFYPSLCARQIGVPLLDSQDADFLAIKAPGLFTICLVKKERML